MTVPPTSMDAVTKREGTSMGNRDGETQSWAPHGVIVCRNASARVVTTNKRAWEGTLLPVMLL